MTNEQVVPQATPEKQTEDSIPTRRLDPGADELGAAEWTWGFSTKHTPSTCFTFFSSRWPSCFCGRG